MKNHRERGRRAVLNRNRCEWLDDDCVDTDVHWDYISFKLPGEIGVQCCSDGGPRIRRDEGATLLRTCE